MATNAEDVYKFPSFNGMRDCLDLTAEFPIGASGAVVTATTDVDDPGITLVRSSQGVYAGTMPASPAGSTSGKQGRVRFGPSLQSSTITTCQVTTYSATAGTFTLKTWNTAGTPVDPANGDIIVLFISIQFRPVP